MRENLADVLRLLLLTDDALLANRDGLAVCAAAVQGGATAVEVRMKRATDHEILQFARALMDAVPVPVFVNDRLDIALAAGADGVHLGPDDISPALARRVAPVDFVIGASVGTASEIERGGPADYWGIGPLRVSPTKPDAGEPLGIDGLRAILSQAGGRPCVAIGGVLPEDVSPVQAIGFAGVAVVSGILAGTDAEAAARRYWSPAR
jgi:thiamine-phosphate pyrophosphorylase